jgi:hypothetical protein
MLIDLPSGAVVALAGSDHDTAEYLRANASAFRDAGVAVLIAGTESAVVQQLADEVWVIEGGSVRQRGHAGDVRQTLNPTLRRGDGRAEVVALETIDLTTGQPARTLSSGRDAAIRVSLRFKAAVPDPVIGIMIRTRIGMEVYGTNTELEGVNIGPVMQDQERTITFRFRCDLCPGFYTVTAASHDKDGTPHDWLEDAISFTVADIRYTAGVANLRATVEVG